MARDEKTPSERTTGAPIDQDETRAAPGPVWSEDQREKERGPMGPIGADLGRRLDEQALTDGAEDIGLTEASQPGQGPTNDDLTPETMIPEDGARHPFERGHYLAADTDLEIVDAQHIGAGGGLDEAEEARLDPLDGKSWDGDPDDSLTPESGINEENSEVARRKKQNPFNED
jgi:hypothetical protein